MSWRNQVRAWVGEVVTHYRRFPHVELATIAQQHEFPTTVMVGVARCISSQLAGSIVKAALRRAATDLDITMDDTELDVLTSVAVAAL